MRYVFGLALVAATINFAACSSPPKSSTLSGQKAGARSAEAAQGPSEFRNNFYTYLKNDGHYSDEDIQKIIYLPTPGVLAPPVSLGRGADPLAPYDDYFSTIKPSDLYKLGVTTPFTMVPNIEDIFRRAGPVHIIIVPGVFGEFIDNGAFQEVFDNPNSTARRRWEQESAGATDTVYSLVALGKIERAMHDLVDVGSIDDASGEPLITVALLKPHVGSMETLGTLASNTDVYLPRINKYLELSGAKGSLYMLGYSRGAAVALDVVATAARAPDENPWIATLKGVIGLAPVIYGTAVANDALNVDTPIGALVNRTKELAEALERCDPIASNVDVIIRNIGRWLAAGPELVFKFTRLPSHPKLEYEKIETATPDLAPFSQFIGRILFQDALRLDRPFGEYCQNVDRFKLITEKFIESAKTLTTPAQMNWWTRNTLPAGLKYFAITATMPDASRSAEDVSDLVGNPVSYDPHSIDYASLRANFYSLWRSSTVELNDSQVILNRARFWPELHQRLNPEQAPMETYFLGTLGTHHWGLAFRRAFPCNDGLEANPFPRTLLLKAIATFVLQTQEADSE